MQQISPMAAPATTILPANKSLNIGKKSKHAKLSSLRKVVKIVKVNLQRRLGILTNNKLYRNSTTCTDSSTKITPTSIPIKFDVDPAFAEEIRQNMLNEIMEAESIASSQNSINSQYEESRMFYRAYSTLELSQICGFGRQCCFLSNAHSDSMYSSFASSIDSLQTEMNAVIMRSNDSLF